MATDKRTAEPPRIAELYLGNIDREPTVNRQRAIERERWLELQLADAVLERDLWRSGFRNYCENDGAVIFMPTNELREAAGHSTEEYNPDVDEVVTCPECDTPVYPKWKRGVLTCSHCRATVRNYH